MRMCLLQYVYTDTHTVCVYRHTYWSKHILNAADSNNKIFI